MLKIMEKYSADLEVQVCQQTMELQFEKQKTEMLIAKMLPLYVFEEVDRIYTLLYYNQLLFFIV